MTTSRGEVLHQGTAYSGQHKAIIDPELWQIVQDKLAANRQERALGVGAEAPSLLAGLIVDAGGHRQAIPLLRLGVASGGLSRSSQHLRNQWRLQAASMKGQGLNDLPRCELERRSSHHKGIFFAVPINV